MLAMESIDEDSSLLDVSLLNSNNNNEEEEQKVMMSAATDSVAGSPSK